MDLQRFVRASTLAMAMAVFAVAPLSAQTTDTDIPEAITDAFDADMAACDESYSEFDLWPTATCLSKALVRHHDALLPYSRILIESVDVEASRGPDPHPLLAQVDLATTAALLGDPGLCADLSDPAMRASCGATIAQIDDDPRRCEALPKPRDAVYCLGYYITVDPGDVGDCRHLGDIGIDDKDIGRMTAADLCLAAAAGPNKTPGLCREIENPELRSECILVSMETPVVRDACLLMAAHTQTDGSYCDHIASEVRRKACLDAAAGEWDGGTQAAADAFTHEFLAALGFQGGEVVIPFIADLEAE